MDTLPTLYTERLILQPLTLDDAEGIQQQFPHWEVVRYLNALVPWPYPADGARSYLEQVVLPAMAQGREWHWSIRLREAPGQLIGNVSLMDEQDNNRGFWLGPQWQGQGLMSEASAAVTAYWFTVLGRPVLRVPKAAPNLGSRRLSEKTGMRLIRTEEGQFVEGAFPKDIWEITREEWLPPPCRHRSARAYLAAIRRLTSLRTMLANSGGDMPSSSERTHSAHFPLRLARSPNNRAPSPLALPRLLCHRSYRRDFSSSSAARSARGLLARLKLMWIYLLHK